MKTPEQIEAQRLIIEGMTGAQWLTGTSGVSPIAWVINLNDYGLAKVNKVSDALIRVCPDFFKADDISTLEAKDVRQPYSQEISNLLVEITPIINELKLPRTNVVCLTLLDMFCELANKKSRDGEPPHPPRF